MKKLFLILFFSTLLYSAQYYKSFNTEYYINDTRLLLYKILNRWNVTELDSFSSPCNKKVSAKLSRGITINYNKKHQTITLHFKRTFAKLLGIFNENNMVNKTSLGARKFNLVEFNNNLFQTISSTVLPNTNNEIGSIILYNIPPKVFKKFSQYELTIILEGHIAGLFEKSSKIALHTHGELFRECKQRKSYPVSLRIQNKDSQETLLHYQMN